MPGVVLGETRPRTIAVLEYRAGAPGAPLISEAMARQLSSLTSHPVVGPAEARRRLGPAVDVAVARCKGEAACIAVIGQRLGCQEVIMVGISQLGDLILAIQRIETRSGQVLARLADSVASTQILGDNDVARYLRRLLPPSDFKRYGTIIVHTSVVGDEVFLDDEPQGRTPLGPLKLAAPGRYTLRVTRPGHEAFLARLDLLPDASVEVTPTLSRITREARWYERWWVWAIIGAVAAGGATAAAVAASSQTPEQVDAVLRLEP